jgi:phosphopantetheine adenylyltransferase
MMVFVRIFKTLFENFEKCYFFSLDEVNEMIKQMQANNITLMVEKYKNIRMTVVEVMLMTVKEFTIRSINRSVRSQQDLTNQLLRQGPIEENKEGDAGVEAER